MFNHNYVSSKFKAVSLLVERPLFQSILKWPSQDAIIAFNSNFLCLIIDTQMVLDYVYCFFFFYSGILLYCKIMLAGCVNASGPSLPKEKAWDPYMHV